MSHSLYTSSTFIGRKKEIEAFRETLFAKDEDRWILHLYGPGGIGKTQLLQQYIEMVKRRQANGEHVLFTQQLIDLYWTTNQQEIGLLKSIAEQLGEHHFSSFFTVIQEYEKTVNRSLDPNTRLFYDEKSEEQNLARIKFFNEYADLPTEQLFLFFDTAEAGRSATERFWTDLLPQLKEKHSGTRVVIAGRQKLEQLDQEQTPTSFLRVTPFSLNEVKSYFLDYGIDVESEIVERIANLSEGRPILIALSIDWLRYGYSPEKLISCTNASDFERLLIWQLQELRAPEDLTIMAMSHFYRRFNERFLAYVLGESVEEAREHIETAAQFSFVKYRPPLFGQPGNCLLHDEMRHLVNTYVWSSLDPERSYRQEWDRKIVDYYAQLIQQEKDYMGKQMLHLERLFYWLSADIEQGFVYSRKLFAEARSRYDTNFMAAIWHELSHFENRLTPAMQNELAFYKGVIINRQGRYHEAVDAFTSLLQKFNMPLQLQVAVRVEILDVYVYTGELSQAVKSGLEWEVWLEELLQTVESELKQQIEYEFGRLCNNIGLAFRNQNKLQITIEYYKKALAHLSLAGTGAYADIANTQNNLAYVLHRLGRDDEALSFCYSSLTIRKRLGSSEQLGYSYTVQAIIYVDQLREREARISFQLAAEEFGKAGSRRGQGLVYTAYGRALRQLGRYIERNGQGEFDPNRQEYLESGQMLHEAVTIFRYLEDEANLSEALNEYGTLLRQQRQWQRAIECFLESKDLAAKMGNKYRVVDNLVDIAITYGYQTNVSEEALAYAIEARAMALDSKSGLHAYNLFAKAQEIIANILFAQRDYDAAFQSVADACIYIWRLDPGKLGESPAKRELYNNQMVIWAEEKILQLPTQELVNEKTTYLIERWQQEAIGQDKLADRYPGFIIRMRGLARDYQFFKLNPVDE